jgi:rhodanese-related sulfurtransferase
MPGFTDITVAQLSRLIGTPDAPAILDVRLPDDAAADPRRIPTAIPVDFRDLAGQVALAAGRSVVVTCQRGRKLSQGAAAALRAAGLRAESLEGGHEAWVAAAQPLTPPAVIPRAGQPWVTRQRPKIDRIACPWLIRRFIDPGAQFLFVPAGDVADVADRFNGIPFDIEGVTYTHRGDRCSFDALLDDFALHTPALDRLALVVRAADTDRHDLAPQAAGLLALSVGLSRQYRDDLAQLEAGMVMYDALYRWARDGFDEGHDWPTGRPA